MDNYELYYQGQLTPENEYQGIEHIGKYFSCINYRDAESYSDTDDVDDYNVLTDGPYTLEEIIKKIELYYGVPLNHLNPTYPVELYKRIIDFYNKFNFGRNDADLRIYCNRCGEPMIRTGYMDDDYVYECPHCKNTSFIGECSFDE